MLKRGELTTQQLVMIIILIISFVVILFLLFRLNLGETTNKEVCHNSVVMVGKGKDIVGELDCKTTYACIGKECKEFVPTTTVDAKTKEDVIKAVKKEIDDCWWMFGEGKIDYAKKWEGYTCAICSVIKFSEEIEDFNLDGKLINADEKYSIITGLDDEVFGSDRYINSTIIKSSEIDSTKCDVFISKA